MSKQVLLAAIGSLMLAAGPVLAQGHGGGGGHWRARGGGGQAAAGTAAAEAATLRWDTPAAAALISPQQATIRAEACMPMAAARPTATGAMAAAVIPPTAPTVAGMAATMEGRVWRLSRRRWGLSRLRRRLWRLSRRLPWLFDRRLLARRVLAWWILAARLLWLGVRLVPAACCRSPMRPTGTAASRITTPTMSTTPGILRMTAMSPPIPRP